MSITIKFYTIILYFCNKEFDSIMAKDFLGQFSKVYGVDEKDSIWYLRANTSKSAWYRELVNILK